MEIFIAAGLIMLAFILGYALGYNERRGEEPEEIQREILRKKIFGD